VGDLKKLKIKKNWKETAKDKEIGETWLRRGEHTKGCSANLTMAIDCTHQGKWDSTVREPVAVGSDTGCSIASPTR
jgi:hypothetical protein